MGGGRNTGGVEGGYVGRVLQHGGQLAGEAVQLLVGDVEARQSGHVGDIVSGDQGHEVMVGPIRDGDRLRITSHMGGRGAGRIIRQAGVVAAGLALGVGAISVFGGGDRPSYRPGTPSVTAFSFSTSVPEGPPPAPEVVPALAAEPSDPVVALAAFLQPLADGRPELAYPLLDEAGRRRYPTLASWARAQVDQPRPVTFTIEASRPSSERPGAVEVDVSATHRPSLDAIRGLVPGRSQSAWLVRNEDDAWRVAAEPATFRPLLPDDAGASDIVQSWVSRMAACDASGAAELQVNTNLYGPSGLARGPCEQRGTWTAGAAVGFDRAPDPRVFLAAFGPEVGTWARLVPVRGPASAFLAAVAPMGDGWQVMGVAVDGQ